MTSRDIATDDQRVTPAVPPPPGATAASFTLFIALTLLLSLIYATREWWELPGGFGFPSDAAWARAVLARNVAAGAGLSFNPGTPAAGAAGVSWIGALAVIGFFSGNFLASAKVLGALWVVLAAFLTWLVVMDLLGDWRFAFLSGLLVAASPRLAAEGLGGTEATWAAMLVAAVIYLQGRAWQAGSRQRVTAALLIGLGALARPELILVLPLVLVDGWLIATVYSRKESLWRVLSYNLPETAGAGAVMLPYLLYNSRAHGPLWQQPEAVLRAQSAWAWPAGVVTALWQDNPVLFLAALAGLPVAALAAARFGCQHRSFLACLLPIGLVLAPASLWPGASPTNAAYTAAYLTPVIAILGAAGLFLARRAASRLMVREGKGPPRWAFAAAIGIACAAVVAPPTLAHPQASHHHAISVKKVSSLQAYIGRWAAEHLAPDASIASREVGAIGYFSRRRMVDLGGTISQEGLAYLSQPGSPDTNLLTYLQRSRPSHLAIRPGDFPDLSERADLLTPAITAHVQDPRTGGTTTMRLYETPWPPPSVENALGSAGLR